jgi:hypothetical protein
MAVSSMLSGTGAPADPERVQLEELIKQVGILAEGMKSSTVQSVGWYLMSVELQQACLRMRSLQATLAERSSRLSSLSVTRRMRSHVQSTSGRSGLGRGGN